MIHVALAANGNYFDGLAATMLSLLASNRSNIFALHVIDGGLAEWQKQFLSERARRFNAQHTVSFHPIGPELFAGFRTDYGNSYMSYARIVVGSLLPCERIIYLDTDLLVAGDILPLWDTELGGNVVAAAPDAGICFLRDDYPFDDDCGSEPYFNSGVMLIDLRRWRELKVQERLLRMIKEAPAKFKWWDQTALNAIFRGHVTFVDPCWNTFAEFMDVRQPARGMIFHYVGPMKPWQRALEDDAYRVWRTFFALHVRSLWTLFRDRRFVFSFLKEKRHILLRESRVLWPATRLALRLRAWLRERPAEPRTSVLLPGLSGNSRPVRTAPTEVDAYVRHRWGSAVLREKNPSALK